MPNPVDTNIYQIGLSQGKLQVDPKPIPPYVAKESSSGSQKQDKGLVTSEFGRDTNSDYDLTKEFELISALDIYDPIIREYR